MSSCCHNASGVKDSSDFQEMENLRYRFFLSLLLGVPLLFLAMAPMVLMLLGYHGLARGMSSYSALGAQWILTTLLLFWVGSPIWKKAGASFLSRNLNMFSLVGVGMGVTFFYSSWHFFTSQRLLEKTPELYFESAAMMMILVLLGQLLEARGHHQAGAALRELLELVPDEVTLFEKGKERRVAISKLNVGDVIRLHPGEKIPVDGKVIEGSSSVNEAMMSGEVFPVEKKEGSAVTAGTLNTYGSFLMRVEKKGNETMLAQMIAMIAAAQQSRAPLQNLTDRVAALVVPLVFLLSVVTFISWWFFSPATGVAFALARAISVLMITCPCALGLAAPMALAVGIGQGARHGILIRDAAALQQLASVNLMAFDKTGTLTEGALRVAAIKNAREKDHADWLSLLASAERHSEHPLAEAIVRYAEEKNLLEKKVISFSAGSGGGISAEVDGKSLIAGNIDYLTHRGIFDIHENKRRADSLLGAPSFASDPASLVFVAVEHELQGVVFLKDSLKESTALALQSLSGLGIEVAMLTGDIENVARSVAQKVGIKTWKAALSPHAKAEQIRLWKREGKRVAMAGDGINDAEALAVADASIAMQQGSNIAKETAGITLLHPSLEGIVTAVQLSRAILQTIRENLLFAFLYNVLSIPLAAGLFYFSWGIVLNPMVATIAMSLSSLSVIGNSLRLKKEIFKTL